MEIGVEQVAAAVGERLRRAERISGAGDVLAGGA
jgi:hypothetical protein